MTPLTGREIEALRQIAVGPFSVIWCTYDRHLLRRITWNGSYWNDAYDSFVDWLAYPYRDTFGPFHNDDAASCHVPKCIPVEAL